MKIEPISGVCAVALAVALVAACGGNDERFPELPGAETLDYQSQSLGVGFVHGGTQRVDLTESNNALAQTRQVADHAVLRLDVYDLRAFSVGEYVQYPPASQDDYRGVSHFENNPGDAALSARAADLHAEVSEATQASGGQDFEKYTIVVDFWSADRQEYIPWDGNTGRPDESNGFYREDMRDEVIADLETVAAEIEPAYVVLGTDMERLLANEDGGRSSQVEFSNFFAFFTQARDAIKAVSPDTRVGPGINWDRFATYVAPAYAGGEDAELGVPAGNEVLDEAFQATLEPLFARADIVSLESYVEPDAEAKPYYQFLRRLNDLYGLDKPVVWYSVGAPTTSAAADATQANYLRQFASWNEGVRPSLVAWRLAFNYDGTDLTGGGVGGRCDKFTSVGSGFEMPLSYCFDGLFSSVLRAKAPYDLLAEEVAQ
ncbi:MAG: hypothetical protein ACQEVA_01390 [Myxococcota bacterium]